LVNGLTLARGIGVSGGSCSTGSRSRSPKKTIKDVRGPVAFQKSAWGCDPGDRFDRGGRAWSWAYHFVPLYLIFGQLLSWFALSGHPTSSKDIELLVLRHEVVVPRRTNPAAAPGPGRPALFVGI